MSSSYLSWTKLMLTKVWPPCCLWTQWLRKTIWVPFSFWIHLVYTSYWVRWRTPDRLKDGSRFTLKDGYDFERYVHLRDELVIQEVSRKLSLVCRKAIGEGHALPYGILHGRDYEDRIITLVYPKGQADNEPCAFIASVAWHFRGRPCFHIGLVMVAPAHQRRGLQTEMTLLSLFSQALSYSQPVWLTDLGRSPSGARQFANFVSDPTPVPGRTAHGTEFQQALAEAWYHKVGPQSGVSPMARRVGFVIQGSNGQGGAQALISRQPKSRHEAFNRWIQAMCPDVADEILIVGSWDPKYGLLGLLAKKSIF